MDKNTPFNIFVLAVFIGLIVPLSVQDGMFMDGQIYAAVSHNLANGYGSFWFPTFSKHFLTDYSEQLPLFFGIQGAFFKVLGNSMYTERIFSFVMAIITGYFIVKIWKLINHDNVAIKKLTWLPIFFWIMIPVISWSYINNVEEVLMGVFATSAVYFILKGLILYKNLILNLIIGGILIFLTSFCKGFQGLFPLVTVAFYWLFFRKISFKHAVFYSVILVLVPTLIYAILFWYPPSFQSLENYANNRLVRTFTVSNSATTTNHFSLVQQMLEQLIPVFILMAISLGLYKWKGENKIEKLDWRKFGFFLAMGLSGSLPLMVTLEQRGFYLTTSFPLTAIALAGIAAIYITPLLEKVKAGSKGLQVFKYISITGLVAVIVLSGLSVGKTKRNENELQDVHIIGQNIPVDVSISVPGSLATNYALMAYFVRYYHVSLDRDQETQHRYFMKPSNSDEIVPKGYQQVPLELMEYNLYEKK